MLTMYAIDLLAPFSVSFTFNVSNIKPKYLLESYYNKFST